MARTPLLKFIGVQFACLIGLLTSVAFAQTASFTITEKAPGQERRVALVIGNGAYQHTSKLPNPPKDAIAIAGALSKLGFEVLRHSDLDQIGMTRAIRGFSDKLKGADVGLVFYAGHGIQVGGKNYLVPVDAKLAEERDLRFEAIDIELILEQLQGGAKIGLVLLDACRDNPLSRTLSRSLGTRSGSVGAGLAPVQTGSGALIAYATQPGNVAEDGRSDNSPFTTALLRHMATPGIEARQMLTRVRADVRELTNGRQIPWDHSSLEKDFYFGAPASPLVAAPLSPSTPDPVTQLRSGAPAVDREALFWQSIQASTNGSDFRAYLETFPTGLYAPIARNRLAALGGSGTPSGNAVDPTSKSSSTTAVLPSRTDVAPPAASPGDDPRIETALGLTSQQRSTVQQALLALGYDPGGTDGALGPRSRTAIEAWQKSARLPETGYLTADQITALMSAAKEPMAKFAQDQKKAQEALLAKRALDEDNSEFRLRQRYDEIVKRLAGQDEVHASHILVETEAQGREIIEALRQGADFGTVARARSKDPSSGPNGGDLGFFTQDRMVPEFGVIAFALKPGEVTKTPVRSPFGYHVIKVEARRRWSPPPFESVREQLRAAMNKETAP